MKKLFFLLVAFTMVLFVSCKESEEDAMEVYTRAIKDYGQRAGDSVTLSMQGDCAYQGKEYQITVSMDCDYQRNSRFGLHGIMDVNMESPDGIGVTFPAEIYMVTEGEDLLVYASIYNQWYYVPLEGFAGVYEEYFSAGVMDSFYERLPELVSCKSLGKTDFNDEKVRRIQVTYLEDYIGKVLEIYGTGDLDLAGNDGNSGLTEEDLEEFSSMLDGVSYEAYINKDDSLVGYYMDLESLFTTVVGNIEEFNEIGPFFDISGFVLVNLSGNVPEEIVVPQEVVDNSIFMPL